MNAQIATLLEAAVRGDTLVLDRLLPLLYDDLRARVRKTGNTGAARRVDAAQLIQDAYMTLYRSASLQAVQRPHYLALAARALHQLLVEHARNGEEYEVVLSVGRDGAALPPAALLRLEERLAALPLRARACAHCRLFAAMDEAETASALGVSDRTVRRDWALARTALAAADVTAAVEGPPLTA